MNFDFKGPLQESHCLTKSWGKVISSTTLLGQDKSIVILHDGQRYTLSITKLRKLILTK
ncbi:hemin uptake protein HemP [Polynucleobacter arcticus]|uniref:hemin uptake protein HemP n=1 Tax=Polynucleobacter arcticus TaxID=1743165 RepID=UPI0015702CEA